MNRPLTTMLPRNAAPTRKLIVSDPGKLDYFARAAYVRAGAAGTWGALSGFGYAPPESHDAGITQDTQSSDSTKAPGAMDTVGDWFRRLGDTVFGGGARTAPQTVYVREEPSPIPYIIGGVALVAAGYAVYKSMK